MTVIYVLVGIVIVFAFYYAAHAINNKGIDKYNYEPINSGTIAFNLLPFSMIIAGMVGNHKGEEHALILGIFFALLFITGLGVYIYKKTSFGIAFLSTLMIAIIGFAFIILVIGAAMAEESRCNQYDDDY